VTVDAACKRHGYDATERYHVPVVKDDPAGEDVWPLERDQCEECRCPPDAKHADLCADNPFPRVLYELLDEAADMEAATAATYRECVQENCADRSTDTPVSIPLGTQIDLFESRRWQSLQQMRDDLNDPEFVARMMHLARERLIAGESEFGSTMYGWEFDERERNKIEEAADWLVYGTSEDSF
jgi:hypothetical protein